MTRSTSRRRSGRRVLEFGCGERGRMRDDRLQTRREPFDFRRPVREQRSRRNQQTRPRFGIAPALENQQQRKHLNSFAESHIVGKASAQAELGEEMEPAHAHFLIGPQFAVQRIAGIDMRQSLRAAQAFQGLRQPGSGYHLRPVGAGIRRRVLGIDVRPGEQAHGLAERQSVLARRPLDLAEALDHSSQAFAVNLYPAAAHERESIGPGQAVRRFPPR